MEQAVAPYCNVWLSRFLPFLRWWPRVNRASLRADFLVYQFALGLGRMDALVNFISHSVVVGFTAGADTKLTQ